MVGIVITKNREWRRRKEEHEKRNRDGKSSTHRRQQHQKRQTGQETGTARVERIEFNNNNKIHERDGEVEWKE